MRSFLIIVFAVTACDGIPTNPDAGDVPGLPRLISVFPPDGSELGPGAFVEFQFSEAVHFASATHWPYGVCCTKPIGSSPPHCNYTERGDTIVVILEPETTARECQVVLGSYGGLLDYGGNQAHASATFPIKR